MKKKTTIAGALGALCIIALLVIPASAMGPDRECMGDGKILDHLEEQGYDLSEVRAAVDTGDLETAHDLMHQFMEEHKEELERPEQPEGMKEMGGNGKMLDHLEEQGFDVSEIRTAIDADDLETAHDLMHQFMEEHREELPTPPEGMKEMRGDGRMLDHLEEQGFDVSAIRTAIDADDLETAHTLMQQFMEEHKGELGHRGPAAAQDA